MKFRSDYKEFELTEDDYGLLVAASKGKIVGKWKSNGQTEAGKAERLMWAWFQLGAKYGFDPWTVLPVTYNKFMAKEVKNG